MNGRNPYNCAEPGNLFVGYERLRQELLNGFRNGRSYAILGGRRCGKTSLLKQIAVDLQTTGLAPLTPIAAVARYSRARPTFTGSPVSPTVYFDG